MSTGLRYADAGLRHVETGLRHAEAGVPQQRVVILDALQLWGSRLLLRLSVARSGPHGTVSLLVERTEGLRLALHERWVRSQPRCSPRTRIEVASRGDRGTVSSLGGSLRALLDEREGARQDLEEAKDLSECTESLRRNLLERTLEGRSDAKPALSDTDNSEASLVGNLVVETEGIAVLLGVRLNTRRAVASLGDLGMVSFFRCSSALPQQ